MATNNEGNARRDKGKPSGANKEEGLGIGATDPEKMEQYDELTDKYTTGEDELAPNAPERHPNRNTSKGEDNPHKGESYS